MKREAIMQTIKNLAKSQGSYGRMYAGLTDLKETDEDAYDELMAEWESQNFTDAVDFILYIEG